MSLAGGRGKRRQKRRLKGMELIYRALRSFEAAHSLAEAVKARDDPYRCIDIVNNTTQQPSTDC